ncbi:translation initiation factor IF-2-like [Artibeus jamaicensis]|uniref:translation initiation factor IF-2-like n=1 Tax=Artibeus jamaicensis TaxID=9417 RepID=UPI00235A7FA8|nr:translation initiation factor IF-2-like [Artibeus jamaicensis]
MAKPLLAHQAEARAHAVTRTGRKRSGARHARPHRPSYPRDADGARRVGRRFCPAAVRLHSIPTLEAVTARSAGRNRAGRLRLGAWRAADYPAGLLAASGLRLPRTLPGRAASTGPGVSSHPPRRPGGGAQAGAGPRRTGSWRGHGPPRLPGPLPLQTSGFSVSWWGSYAGFAEGSSVGTNLHSLVGRVWEFVSEAVGASNQECIGRCTEEMEFMPQVRGVNLPLPTAPGECFLVWKPAER